MPYKIVLTDSFKRSLKRLQKRYPQAKADVKEAVGSLLQNPQAGVIIPRGSGVRKLRVRNSNLQRGKSGGYRLLYFSSETPEPAIYLLLLYAKSDQADVSLSELSALLDDLEQIL